MEKNLKNKQEYSLVDILFCLFSIMLLIITILLDTVSTKNWITKVATITFIYAIVGTVFLLKKGFKLYSLPIIFLLCTYLFNYSQLWLIGIFKFYDFSVYAFDMLTIYPTAVYQFTCRYTFFSNVFLTLGVAFSYKEDNGFNNSTINSYLRWETNTIATTILIISLPFYFYSLIVSLITGLSSGYHALNSLYIHDYIDQIGWMSVLGFSLIISSKNDKKSSIFYFLFPIILYGLRMLSGDRGNAVIAILVLSIFYFYTNKKKGTIWKSIITIIAVFLLAWILETIKIFRNVSNHSILMFFTVMFSNNTNIIFRTMEEFGSTIAVPSITKMYIDETGAFLYGWTYISGLLSVFPNVFNINKLILSGELVSLLRNNGINGIYKSFGGSYIAEIFLNFGYLGPILLFFWGKALGKIDHNIRTRISKKQSLLIYPIIVFGCLIWIRWDFNIIIRPIIWSGLLFFFIRKILDIRKNNKKVKL